MKKKNNKSKNKMNALYKIAFILMFVCIALLVAGGFATYLFEKPQISIILTASGTVLSLAGIILALLSSPKKKKKTENFIEEEVDSEEKI